MVILQCLLIDCGLRAACFVNFGELWRALDVCQFVCVYAFLV